MIELNDKTQQDFLNRWWVQKLLDVGIDMSDTKYALVILDNKEWVTTKEALEVKHINAYFVSSDTPKFLPTYTVSDLLYKLHEYGHTTIELGKYILVPIIEYLASLLIQCHKKDIGIAKKDTGNTSDK